MKAMGRDMIAPLASKANSQRNFLQADVIPELSDYYHWSTIRPLYVQELLSDAVFPCGAPRVDDVITPKVPAQRLRDRYGIANGKTVVLFAPTWRGNSTKITQVFVIRLRFATRWPKPWARIISCSSRRIRC